VEHLVKGNNLHVELIRNEMKARGWNAAKLSRVSGVSTGVLSRYFNNDGISSDNLYAVMQALDLHSPTPQSRPIPVISWVHAGEFSESDDRWPPGVSGVEDPVFSYLKTGPHAFGLRVQGDSMLPRFMPGDIAIVDPSVPCDNGSPGVVSVNGEVQLRFFWDKETEIVLKSMNDKYPEIIIKKDSKVDFKVIGKVVDIKVKF
jgi:SOS-response transcriptional repressor LexA